VNTEQGQLLRRYRAQVFSATWLSYAGFYLCRKVYAVVKYPLKLQFGFSDEQVAAPWTVYLITYMLGQFLAAWLGRHVQSRRVLAYGMAVAAASNMALGLLVDSHRASVFMWLCVTMGIHGFAQATGWSHNVALFANWTHRSERGTLFGIWGTCYQLGAIAGKGLAGFLLGWLGMAWSFFGSSIVLFAITIAFVVLARERPQSVGLSLEDQAEPDVPAGTQGAERQEASLARAFILSIAAMGFIYFGFKFLRYALDSWSALILSEHFHFSQANAAYLSSVFDWVGFLGVIAAGYWSDRMPDSRRTPVIFYLTFGCLVFTVLMWLVGLSSSVAFVVLLGLIGFTQLGPDALLSGACAMDVGNRRQAALAAGVINGCGSVGPIVQEPLIGWIKQTSGLNSVFLLLVAVGAVTTVATWLLMRYERTNRLGQPAADTSGLAVAASAPAASPRT
jgi:sugar phosphate permease